MITFRRDRERRHERRSTHERWLTFYAREPDDPLGAGFDGLELLDEYQIAPAARLPRETRRDSETITYVREGSLTHEDSSGGSGILQAGEFQRTTVGRGVRFSQGNPSRIDLAHVVRASLRGAQVGLASEREQRRFSVAERRGGLCVVASQDGRNGSLRLHQDVLVHSALLDAGQHVAYELAAQHTAWLHVLSGGVNLGGVALTRGDGAGIRGEPSVSFTATAETEVLLLDLVGADGDPFKA